MVKLSDRIICQAKIVYQLIHMKPFIISYIILILFSCSPAAEKDENRMLVFNPQLDSLYHLTATTIVSGEWNSHTNSNSETLDFSLACIKKADSISTIRLVFEKINLASGNIKAVTEKIAGNPMMADYFRFRDSLLLLAEGQSLLVTCDQKGEVLKVDGFDQIVDRITESIKQDRRTINSILRETIGSKQTTDLIRQSLFFLSGRNIKAGDNWVSNITLIAKAPVKYSNMIIVKEIKGDSVFLDVKTVVSAKTGEEGVVYAQGKQEGSVIVSLTTGIPYMISLNGTTVTKTDHYEITQKRQFSVHLR